MSLPRKKAADRVALSLLITFPLLFSGCISTDRTGLAKLGRARIQQTAAAVTNLSTLFLTSAERVRIAETFLDLVQIKGPSGHEQAIAAELHRRLTPLGAKEILPKRERSLTSRSRPVPFNFVMEFPATGTLTNLPGILLNAHIDTIEQSNPERLSFDPATADFFHLDEGIRGKSSSFGGDDRSAVAVIVESLRLLHEKFWSKGVPHRRILILFTAEEETGLHGAKYLAREQPEVFAGLDISLTMDGPIDLRSNYPKDSFVFVVAKTNEVVEPYQRFLRLAADYSKQTKTTFGLTEFGLNAGDFAAFPPEAKAALHLRSPVRGWHSHEHVKLHDLLTHTDLLTYLLLAWDNQLPEALQ
jgi:hypothetical protein